MRIQIVEVQMYSIKKLSNDRAQTCVEYLLSNGINEDKLIYKGFGKDQLLITNKEIAALPEDEREEAHQKNRRTEFKIIE